jgi:hypothetical protein
MDPNPVKHFGSVMRRIRSQVETALLAAGFEFEGRNKRDRSEWQLWADYTRPGMLLSFYFDKQLGSLVVETVDETGKCSTPVITAMQSPRSYADGLARIDEFIAQFNTFITTLPALPASDRPTTATPSS